MKNRALRVTVLVICLILLRGEPLSPVMRVHVQSTYNNFIPMYFVGATETQIKKGLGEAKQYAEHTCEDASSLNVGWLYDWSADPRACFPNIESVSQAWNAVPERIGGNSKWLMGFNEPDLWGQANLSPELAATLWDEIEQRFPDQKLVAPAPGDIASGWLERFYKAYWLRYDRSPRLDALAMHCYGRTAGECIAVLDKYKALAHQWNVKEIWVTEFAFLEQPMHFDKSIVEMQTFVNYLEADSFVTRYAWWNARHIGNEAWAFGVDVNPSLVNFWTGQLTSLGSAYRALP